MEAKLLLQRRFFLTLHYDTGFLPSTLDGMVNRMVDLLDDLSALARADGILLKAKYSIVTDRDSTHVHVILNWLPTHNYSPHKGKNQSKRINRPPVLDLIYRNWFVIDDKVKGIKFITKTPEKVERYITDQPKRGQSVIYSGRYTAYKIEAVYSKDKSQSYYTSSQMMYHPYSPDKTSIPLLSLYLVWLVTAFLLISLSMVYLL